MNVDLQQVTTLVFDVDGTLYRQGPLRRQMLFKLLGEAMKNPAASWGMFRALSAYRRAQEVLRESHVDGDIARAQLRLASERCGRPEDVVAEMVARWMDREPLPLLEKLVDPGLRSFLDAAKSRGLRLGVLSDYPAVAKLAAMKLDGYFEVVVSAQDAGINRFKPHPSGLLEALRRLGAATTQALYIGDRHEVDGAVARAVGVRCVIVGQRGEPNASEGWIPVANYGALEAMLFRAHPA
jgi:HAD superfamily hydrolase (TIGR01509 family)